MYHDTYYAVGIEPVLGPLVIIWLVLGIPLWRILRHAGFSGAWVLLLIVPPIGWLVITLILAFARWPARTRRPGR